MIYNWSKYRRKQNNIDKSEYNYIVNELINKHHRYLHSLLVKTEQDEDTFNDTYLKLTRFYNPDRDFIEQFKFYFKQLSGQYRRDDKCYNYAEKKVELYTDNILMIDEEPSNEEIHINSSLIENIQKYAIFEKEQKNKAKTNAQNRKIEHISN